jgi:hypothetical protein
MSYVIKPVPPQAFLPCALSSAFLSVGQAVQLSVAQVDDLRWVRWKAEPRASASGVRTRGRICDHIIGLSTPFHEYGNVFHNPSVSAGTPR